MQVTEAVLGASAVLAWLYKEPGMDRVADALDNASLLSINAAEVVTKLIQNGSEPAEAIRRVRNLPCLILAADEELGYRSGELVTSTRHKGLSLADRFCLALAERERLPVLTADCAWKELDLGVEIVLIR